MDIAIPKDRPLSKESVYELQKLDCNCNDCGYLVRDLAKFNEAVKQDKEDQQFFFDAKVARLTEAALELIEKNKKRGEAALKYAKSLKHQYQAQQKPTHYGRCAKLGKEITFVANVLQLDTQHCFVHRKDL